MSDLASLLEKTRAAQAAVSRLENALASRPRDAALQINLQTQRRLAARFEQKFLESAKSSHIDICRYRIIPNISDEYPISAVAGSLEKFQELFTMVYGALRYKAQRMGQNLLQETTLEFGYTYSGSLGIVLVAQGGRDLFFTKFEHTIDTVQELFEISSQDEVLDLAHQLGNPVVKRAYEWALENFRGDFSIDLTWEQADGKHKGGLISKPQIARIVDLIGLTSEEILDTVAPVGVLVGVNIRTRSFHFVIPDGESFRGSLGPNFPVSGTIEVGKRYRARILMRTVKKLATETEERRNTLLALENDPYA